MPQDLLHPAGQALQTLCPLVTQVIYRDDCLGNFLPLHKEAESQHSRQLAGAKSSLFEGVQWFHACEGFEGGEDGE